MSKEELLEQGVYIPDKFDELIIIYLKLGFKVLITCEDHFPYNTSPFKKVMYSFYLSPDTNLELEAFSFINVSIPTKQDLEEEMAYGCSLDYKIFPTELNQLLCRLKNYSS